MSLLSMFSLLSLVSCLNSEEKGNIMSQNDGTAVTNDRLEWFRDAKFGMFIHWGPYSRLAGEWNGKQVPVGENAEWIMKKLTIPVDVYRDLAHEFNPVLFDAHKWVSLAKAAGMKYIVITAKHHDGFAMYHSGVSSYNIVDWTSFKRDPLKELAEACREEGIRFCFYYSHREDWDHPGGYGNNWDYDNDWGSDLYNKEKFTRYLVEKAKPQLRELLTNYGPVGLVWFDRGMYTPEQGRDFVNLVREIQPDALVNGRVGHYDQEFLGDYQSMGDNGMPPGGLEEYWETPMTLNRTWGFSRFDTLWKSPSTVIQRLVEIVSRGGNYLLNIGPQGSGEIPEATMGIFSQVGPWVGRNAEAIYGTSANPFGELDWGYCTVKDNRIFLFVRNWTNNASIELKGLRNEVKSVSLLTSPSVKLPFRKDSRSTTIILSADPPDSPFSVVVVETEGPPEVSPQVVSITGGEKKELNYLTAITNGNAVTRFNRKGGFHISKWTGPDDSVDWNISIEKPGKYSVVISYAANKEWEGKSFEIISGGSHLKANVVCTGDWYEYQEFPVGYIDFPEPGLYTLTIRPGELSDTYLMYLRSITLNPVSSIKKYGWGVD